MGASFRCDRPLGVRKVTDSARTTVLRRPTWRLLAPALAAVAFLTTTGDAGARVLAPHELVASGALGADRGVTLVPGPRGRALAVSPGAPRLTLALPARRGSVAATRVRVRLSGCGGGRLLLQTGRRRSRIAATRWIMRDATVVGDRLRVEVPPADVDARCRLLIGAVEMVESVPVGAALWSPYLDADPRYLSTFLEHFRQITPENELKMALVHPEQDRWDFAGADRLVELAEWSGSTVHGHVLVWGEHLPGWIVKHDALGRSPWTPDTLRAALKDHVQTLVRRYKGRIRSWDVVNEAVGIDGRLKRNFLLDKLGPSYVEDAFRWAQEADPDARLFINEKDADVASPRAIGLLNLVKDLRAKGLRVDGVGLQNHLSLKIPPTTYGLHENMRTFSDAGFAVRVTELDVARENQTPNEEVRGRIYRSVADACLMTPTCEAVTVWGIGDRFSWHGADAGALPFDAEFAPKPWWQPFADRLAGRA